MNTTKTGFVAKTNSTVLRYGKNLCDVAGLARPGNGVTVIDLSSGRTVDAGTVYFYSPRTGK